MSDKTNPHPFGSRADIEFRLADAKETLRKTEELSKERPDSLNLPVASGALKKLIRKLEKKLAALG